jgi:hypothetical protein
VRWPRRIQDKPLPAGLRIVPDLAESLPSISPNRKTCTFQIRKDARFSDGRPVTARNFVHAIERILNPAMSSTSVGAFESLVGAQAVLDGKTNKVAGAVARGRTLILRLTKPVPDFVIGLAGFCAVPESLPIDPEGTKAPLASPAPYFVAQYVPGERIVLERNRFYKGARPHHLDRFVVELGVDIATAFARVETDPGTTPSPPTYFVENAARLARRHGVNKTQFFVVSAPESDVRPNASRPSSRPMSPGRHSTSRSTATDARARCVRWHADRSIPTFHDAGALRRASIRLRTRPEELAPRGEPTVRKACSVLDGPVDVACEILKQNSRQSTAEISAPLALLFQKLATPGEPPDIGRVSWMASSASVIGFLFDGDHRPAEFTNWSYFDSPTFNRKLDRASSSHWCGARPCVWPDRRELTDAAPAIP